MVPVFSIKTDCCASRAERRVRPAAPARAGEVAELGDGGVVRDPEIDARAEAYAGVVDEVEVKVVCELP
jgi:hypothetical protein